MVNVEDDTKAPIPAGISPALYDFLAQCFQKDPSQRPGARKLRNHAEALAVWTFVKKIKAEVWDLSK